MYDRILFPTDGSQTAGAAFEYALDVASAHGAMIRVLSVVDTGHGPGAPLEDEMVDRLEGEASQVVGQLEDRAAERGVPVETAVRRGQPPETIVEYGETTDVDVIVMATHGDRDLDRLLLGSVTERVINTAAVPVLTVTPDPDSDFGYPCTDVLVPVDGSRGADAALKEGIGITKATDATLHLLCVVETQALGDADGTTVVGEEAEAQATEVLARANETARAATLEAVTTTVAQGRPHREILGYATERDVGLIALGAHGTTDFSRYVLGGVSAKIVRSAPVPVLMTRAED